MSLSSTWSPVWRATQLARRNRKNEMTYCHHESSWSDDFRKNTSQRYDCFELGSPSRSHYDSRRNDRTMRDTHYECRVHRTRLWGYRGKNNETLRENWNCLNTMWYWDYTPSSHHPKKPLSKAELKKMQEAYSRADEISAEVKKQEEEEQKRTKEETNKMLNLL